jgi:hypothetical protein
MTWMTITPAPDNRSMTRETWRALHRMGRIAAKHAQKIIERDYIDLMVYGTTRPAVFDFSLVNDIADFSPVVSKVKR